MPRYSEERKEAVLRKMLPPSNRALKELAAEEGISVATLYNWRRQARARGRLLPIADAGREGWSAADKFAAVVETAALNAAELGEYCRQRGLYPQQIQAWRAACEQANDWDTFWVVLDHPQLPLTNNAAARALRHWVIARRLSYGSRNAQGSRAFTALAGVIETCRQRGLSPWTYIAKVLGERRQGNPAPPMPAAAAASQEQHGRRGFSGGGSESLLFVCSMGHHRLWNPARGTPRVSIPSEVSAFLYETSRMTAEINGFCRG